VKELTLEGVFSVLPTPFTDDGALDERGVEGLVRAHVAAGVRGLTVLGVMGEADEQSEEERSRVVGAVLRTREALPVILGVTGAEASVVERRARDAAAAGVDAVMVSPTRTLGLAAAVAAAAAGGLPVVIQDYPAGSGVPLTTAEIATVARAVGLVAGVKTEAPPTASAIRELRSVLPGLPALGGLGGLFLIDELRAGATGTLTGFPLPGALERIVRTSGTTRLVRRSCGPASSR
jgi:4-hydroxy-tetrahydrodipicolinate synthase